MKKSFTIRRTDDRARDLSTLMPRILEETGSEAEAASILRSIERVGTDEAILSWVMTCETKGPKTGGLASPAWRVRADRGAPATTESTS